MFLCFYVSTFLSRLLTDLHQIWHKRVVPLLGLNTEANNLRKVQNQKIGHVTEMCK
jgi:hypothetical protein